MSDSNFNMDSFLSISTRGDFDNQINNIITNNLDEYTKLCESINMLDEIIIEEKEKKLKIKKEMEVINNIQTEAENLFSKILDLYK